MDQNSDSNSVISGSKLKPKVESIEWFLQLRLLLPQLEGFASSESCSFPNFSIVSGTTSVSRKERWKKKRRAVKADTAAAVRFCRQFTSQNMENSTSLFKMQHFEGSILLFLVEFHTCLDCRSKVSCFSL